MPELPDIVTYVHALRPRVVGQAVRRLRLGSPFVLRSVDPPPEAAAGATVTDVRRLGKQIVLALDNDVFVIVHLMIAGRLHWRKPGAGIGGKTPLAAVDFDAGTLVMTEASTRKRAALHLAKGEAALAAYDRGGLEVLYAGPEAFREALQRENHTLKRALTDPRLFSGIGNAYSDEILHRARLSPFTQTRRMPPGDAERLHAAARCVLLEWTERLVAECGDGFPEKVTAFREGMAVHGRFRRPCPACQTPVQRIVYAENEANYCPTCQTGGRLLADRALSRLLREDWPRTLTELEEMKAERSQGAR